MMKRETRVLVLFLLASLFFSSGLYAEEPKFYSSESSGLTTYLRHFKKRIIVGGKDARIGEASYVARIEINTLDDSFQCTGSLVSQEWVLTAAHCFFDGKKRRSTSSIIALFENAKEPVTVDSDWVVIHPDYKVSRPLYDLALVRLKSRVVEIDPIRLIAPTERISTNIPAQLFGYGYVLPYRRNEIIQNEIAKKLQTTYLPIIERETAMEWIAAKAVHGEEIFDRSRIAEKNTPDYFAYIEALQQDQEVKELLQQLDFVLPTSGIIFVGSDKNTTACHGDSGGPLVIFDPSGKTPATQAGVLHSGYFGCGFHHSPNLYIDLRPHLHWIHSNVYIQRMHMLIPESDSKPTVDGIDI